MPKHYGKPAKSPKKAKKPNLYALKYSARKKGQMSLYRKLDAKIKRMEGKA